MGKEDDRGAMSRPIRIGISLGDIGGVGPETAAKALLAVGDTESEFTLYCNRELFAELGGRFRWAAELLDCENARFSGTPEFGGHAPFGRPTPQAGKFAFHSLETAAKAALAGKIDAIITAPLSKEGLKLAGYNYPGNTEILRDIAGVERVVMMLIADDFRVVPATRHIPISSVPDLITEELIEDTVRILTESLVKYERIEKPRIGVLALNPHGGEGGLLGDEETKIRAAVERLRLDDYTVEGPLVPDIAFIPRFREKYDAVVGMYHDQVLIPLKMAGFERGVNATLGLPFIRTSPDHGTAFDIAGKDIADPTSTIEAIKLAIKWARATRFSLDDSSPTD